MIMGYSKETVRDMFSYFMSFHEHQRGYVPKISEYDPQIKPRLDAYLAGAEDLYQHMASRGITPLPVSDYRTGLMPHAIESKEAYLAWARLQAGMNYEFAKYFSTHLATVDMTLHDLFEAHCSNMNAIKAYCVSRLEGLQVN